MLIKTTTPTPSLNNDSPVILVSSEDGMFAFLKSPRTAIGSVGDMSAPSNKQYIKGMFTEKNPKINYIQVPMHAVEIITPNVENNAIGVISFFNLRTSTCNAPANKRKLSIIRINIFSKSIDFTACVERSKNDG